MYIMPKMVRNVTVPLKHPGVKPSFPKATSTLPAMQKGTTHEKNHVTILPQHHSELLTIDYPHLREVPPLTFYK